MSLKTFAIIAGLLMLASDARHAVAQGAVDFYRGKTLTLGVPTSAGGGYDVYGRALAHHIAKHIPGAPNVVVQNVGAGAGMVLANQLYNTAAKDGTYLAMVRGPLVHEQVFNNPQVRFDARKFTWIGNMNADVDACVVSTAIGVNLPADLYVREFAMGASGVGAQSYTFPLVYRELLGMKLKVIAGYPGTSERMLAIERRELDGFCGVSISTFRSQLAGQAERGVVKLVAQAGLDKDSRYSDLPNILDEAKTPEIRQALEFLFVPLAINRAIAAPPEVPDDRAAILRSAFIQSLKDPAFVEEANKLRMDISVMDAGGTASIVNRLFNTPPEAVVKIKNLVHPTAK